MQSSRPAGLEPLSKKPRLVEPESDALAAAAPSLCVQPASPRRRDGSFFLLTKFARRGVGDWGVPQYFEGHAQVLVPGHGYFGLTYDDQKRLPNGQRKYCMNDALLMINPDAVVEIPLRAEGLSAVLETEKTLEGESDRVGYDREGKQGINCLIAAARLVEAGSGVPIEALIHPELGLEQLAEDINDVLVDSGVSPQWHDQKEGDISRVLRVVESTPDRNP